MSIRLMTDAWQLLMPATKKMVLLALCDHANDEGGSLHPSIKSISIKASISERQAQRIIHALIEDGFLSVVGNEFGGAPGATRRYQINLKKLKTGDTHVTGDKMSRVTNTTETGDICDMRRVTFATETGDTHVTQTIKLQPSIETSINHQVREAQILPGWLKEKDWEDFKNHRVALKAKLTAEAERRAIKSLEALVNSGNDPGDVINQSIINGWKGLFPVSQHKNNSPPSCAVYSGTLKDKQRQEVADAIFGNRNKREERDITGVAECLD